MKFSVAHSNPGKRSTENFTKISRQISQHLWQRKTEKYFTSALLQGSCSRVVLELFSSEIACHVLELVSQKKLRLGCIQQFARVTSIGSLPPKALGKSCGAPQSPAETPQNPRRDPAEPSERPPQSPLRGKISSESLAEGCATRMVTLRNFRSVSCFGVLGCDPNGLLENRFRAFGPK